MLIDALARLPRRDVIAVLVGADQGRHRYAAALVRQAQALGVADRLRLAGECDDMPAALLLSDVVVHASTQAEAFGRVVIEAQAMGRPVIAADLGGPGRDGGARGHRPARAPRRRRRPGRGDRAHAGAVARPAPALGAAARASVLRSYTVRAMQEATLDVYEAVMGG